MRKHPKIYLFFTFYDFFPSGDEHYRVSTDVGKQPFLLSLQIANPKILELIPLSKISKFRR
jgi:hypothetical protein